MDLEKKEEFGEVYNLKKSKYIFEGENDTKKVLLQEEYLEKLDGF